MSARKATEPLVEAYVSSKQGAPWPHAAEEIKFIQGLGGIWREIRLYGDNGKENGSYYLGFRYHAKSVNADLDV